MSPSSHASPSDTLAIELWQQIGSHLCLRDLSSLSRSSSSLLTTIRPLVYRTVRLTLDEGHSTETLHLLALNTKLSKFVVNLTLLGPYNNSPTPKSELEERNLDAVWNMTSLKHLKLMGSEPIFHTASAQQQFLDKLRKSPILLEGLTCSCPFPGDDLSLPNLKSFEWDNVYFSKPHFRFRQFCPHLPIYISQ